MAAGDTRVISMSAEADDEAGIGGWGLGTRTSSAWSETIVCTRAEIALSPQRTIAGWPVWIRVTTSGRKYAMARPDSIRTLLVDSYCGRRAAKSHQVQATSKTAAANRASLDVRKSS